MRIGLHVAVTGASDVTMDSPCMADSSNSVISVMIY